MLDRLEHEILQIIVGYLDWRDVIKLQQVVGLGSKGLKITDPRILDKHHMSIEDQRVDRNYIQFFQDGTNGISVYIYSITQNLVYHYDLYQPFNDRNSLRWDLRGKHPNDEFRDRKWVDVMFDNMIAGNPIIKNPHYVPPGFSKEVKYYMCNDQDNREYYLTSRSQRIHLLMIAQFLYCLEKLPIATNHSKRFPGVMPPLNNYSHTLETRTSISQKIDLKYSKYYTSWYFTDVKTKYDKISNNRIKEEIKRLFRNNNHKIGWHLVGIW